MIVKHCTTERTSNWGNYRASDIFSVLVQFSIPDIWLFINYSKLSFSSSSSSSSWSAPININIIKLDTTITSETSQIRLRWYSGKVDFRTPVTPKRDFSHLADLTASNSTQKKSDGLVHHLVLKLPFHSSCSSLAMAIYLKKKIGTNAAWSCHNDWRRI